VLPALPHLVGVRGEVSHGYSDCVAAARLPYGGVIPHPEDELVPPVRRAAGAVTQPPAVRHGAPRPERDEADRQDVSNIGRRTRRSRGSDDTLPWRSRGSDDTLPWRSGRTLDTLSRRTLRPDDTLPWRSLRPRRPWWSGRTLRSWLSRARCRAPSGGRRRAVTVTRCHRHGAPQSGR